MIHKKYLLIFFLFSINTFAADSKDPLQKFVGTYNSFPDAKGSLSTEISVDSRDSKNRIKLLRWESNGKRYILNPDLSENQLRVKGEQKFISIEYDITRSKIISLEFNKIKFYKNKLSLSEKDITKLHLKRPEIWDKLPGLEVCVSANPLHPSKNILTLHKQRSIMVIPHPGDSWNTSPIRWPNVNYKGHLHSESRADNGMPFMELCYALNQEKLKALPESFIINIRGSLTLAPSDFEGGGSPENNTGFIRVKIILLD